MYARMDLCPHSSSVVKNLSASAEDVGFIPGSRRSSGEGNGNQVQYSCMGNPMDSGAWWATVTGSQKSQTRLSDKTIKIYSFSCYMWVGSSKISSYICIFVK